MVDLIKNFNFIGANNFKSSKNNKEYHTITLAKEGKDGKGTAITCFVDEMPEIVTKLSYLDETECTLAIESLSEKPKLVSINKIVKKLVTK